MPGSCSGPCPWVHASAFPLLNVSWYSCSVRGRPRTSSHGMPGVVDHEPQVVGAHRSRRRRSRRSLDGLAGLHPEVDDACSSGSAGRAPREPPDRVLVGHGDHDAAPPDGGGHVYAGPLAAVPPPQRRAAATGRRCQPGGGSGPGRPDRGRPLPGRGDRARSSTPTSSSRRFVPTDNQTFLPPSVPRTPTESRVQIGFAAEVPGAERPPRPRVARPAQRVEVQRGEAGPPPVDPDVVVVDAHHRAPVPQHVHHPGDDARSARRAGAMARNVMTTITTSQIQAFGPGPIALLELEPLLGRPDAHRGRSVEGARPGAAIASGTFGLRRTRE